MREIIVDSFAGGGGASTGIEMATGTPVDVAINHDEAAILMHKTNHPQTKHYCENIWEVDPIKATEGKPVALMWASPDCFPAGILILTKSGYRPIETIRVGDYVLTHKKRWKKVTEISNTIKPLIEIKGHGHPGLICSPEHPFYVKKRTNLWNNDIRQYRPVYSKTEWMAASKIDNKCYWSTPTNIPKVDIPKMEIVENGTSLPIDERLMWLAGRYVGDGWTRFTNRRAELVIICGKHEASELSTKLDMWPRSGARVKNGELSWNCREVRTAVQFMANSRSLVKWLRENFGHGADKKTIPAWIYGAKDSYKTAFLNGYTGADGWNGCTVYGKKITEINTVSKAIAFGIKQLVTTMGYIATTHRSDKRANVIEGRTVNAKPCFKVRWRKEIDGKHNQVFIEDG